MLAPGDAQNIAQLCKAIGNEVTEDSGFVPVRKLLSRFNADLVLRPLLVEGMLASVSPASNNGHRWAVLVDTETYSVSRQDIQEERLTRPLPARMRNTIAHELVHSLAFRTSEFGLRLKARTDTKDGMRQLLSALERETEQFSPLLLWSEKALGVLLSGRKQHLTLLDFADLTQRFGVSRYLLITRLKMLNPAADPNGFLFSPALRNVAIGIGVWGAKGAYLKGWPLFANFDDVVPSFILSMSGQDRMPAERLFSKPAFSMLGGADNVLEMETTAGTPASPDAKKVKVRISVEETLRRHGEEFLFTVHGL